MIVDIALTLRMGLPPTVAALLHRVSQGLLDAKTPLLKETLDVELWEERRVKDTPHGFFAKMMGREAVRVSKIHSY